MALNRAQLGQAAAAPGKIEHQQVTSAMRILVITDLYPPVGFGGYELECAALVRWLRRSHDVLVLTSDLDRGMAGPEADIRRGLPYLAFRRGGPTRAPAATLPAPR